MFNEKRGGVNLIFTSIILIVLISLVYVIANQTINSSIPEDIIEEEIIENIEVNDTEQVNLTEEVDQVVNESLEEIPNINQTMNETEIIIPEGNVTDIEEEENETSDVIPQENVTEEINQTLEETNSTSEPIPETNQTDTVTEELNQTLENITIINNTEQINLTQNVTEIINQTINSSLIDFIPIKIKDFKIKYRFVNPSAMSSSKDVEMELIAAYNILGLDYAKSVQAIRLTNPLNEPKKYKIVISYPKEHSQFEDLKLSYDIPKEEVEFPEHFGYLIRELKSGVKPTPQKDFAFKTYDITMASNSEVEILASIIHDNIDEKRWYVHIIGSSGGTSLLYESGNYKIYDIDGNIWWRRISVNNTISASTILDFPHSIDFDSDRVHPAKVQWENDTLISIGEKWGGVTDELEIDSTNNLEVNWKTPIALGDGDELRIALGKKLNFTGDDNYATKMSSVIANLSLAPSNAIMNITGSSDTLQLTISGCTNTGGGYAGDDTDCCGGFQLFFPGGGYCTSDSSTYNYKAYNVTNPSCSQAVSSPVCNWNGHCFEDSPSGNVADSGPGQVIFKCSSGGVHIDQNDAMPGLGYYGTVYYTGSSNTNVLFATLNITFNISDTEIYSKDDVWMLNNITEETTDFGGNLSVGENNLTFTSQTGGDLYIYFNKQAENEVPNLTGIPDNSTNEDTNTSNDWIDLWPYATDDVDNDSDLTFSVDSQTNSSLIDCFIYTDRYLTCGIVGYNQSGYSDVTVKATDTNSGTNTDRVRITVDPVNDAPYWASEIPDANTTENSIVNISINLWNYPYDNENNNSQLNFTVVSQSNVSLINCSIIFDKFLICAPSAENQTGVSTLNISINDTGGLSDTDLIKITVNAFNDYPYFLVDTSENSTLDNATIKGNYVNFTANIQDYDGDNVTLLICDSSGLSGISCANTEFCSDPVTGEEGVGLKNCVYNTSSTSERSYSWTSFACDNSSQCINGSTGTFYISIIRTLNLTVENMSEIWYYNGNMLTPKNINEFSQELIDAQSACTPDADGYCNISLDLESTDEGLFEIYNIQINYNTSDNRAPEIDSYLPVDLTPEVDEGSSLEFSHTSSDNDGDNITYNWTLDGTQQSTNLGWLYAPNYGDAGEYNVTLIISDDSGLIDLQEWNVSVLFEDQSPIITLENPINYYVTASNSVTFNCSATDDYQLSNITLYHDISGTFEVNETKSISGTFDSETFTITNIPAGTYKWNCKGYDNNTQSVFADSNYTFTITSVSYITLNSPINNSLVSSSQSISFNYTVEDPANSVDNCSLFINNILNSTDTTITEDIGQYFDLNLNDGTYEWKIGCYNNNSMQSNSSIYNLSVAYNNPPVVIDLTQNETEIYQGEMFEIRCLISDTETANESLDIRIEYQHGGDVGWHYCEADWDNSSKWWGCMREPVYSDYSIGNWDFRCNVSDTEKSSGWTTDTDTLYVASNNPNTTIDLQSPINESELFTTSINFTYNMSSLNVIDNCSLYLYKSGSWELNKTDSNIEETINQTLNITLEEGSYLWKIGCYDAMDVLVNSTTFNLTIDITSPILQNQAPINYYNSSTAYVNFTYNVSDYLSIDSCSLWLLKSGVWGLNKTDSDIEETINQTFNLTVEDQNMLWLISCNDTLNNKANSTTYNLTVDTTPPIINNQAPVNNTNVTSSSVNFTYNVTDDLFSIDSCILWLQKAGTWELNKTDSSITETINQTFNLTIENSNVLWKIECNDTLNNKANSSVYNLTISPAKPTVELQAPTNNSYFESSVDFIFNVSSSSTTVNNCTLWLNNLENETITKDWSNQSNGFSTSALPSSIPKDITTNGSDFWITDGSYWVYHTDSEGNNISDGFSTSSFGSNYPYGITTNGSDFWIVDANDNWVYHTDANGNNQSDGFSTATLGSVNPYGITTNGSDFWITDSIDDWVYHTDASGNNQSDGFSTTAIGSGDTYGITTNGSDFWMVDNSDNFVYHTDNNGNNQSDGFDVSSFGSALPIGITTPSLISGSSPTEFWIIDGIDIFAYHIEKGLVEEENNTINLDLSYGIYNWSVSCYDDNSVQGNSTIYKLIILGNKVYSIKDTSSDDVASFYEYGLVLKGSCIVGTCNSPSDNSFIIQDSSSNNNSYINTTGDLCIETGDCSDLSASCTPPDGSFIVQNNEGTNVSYIDSTGDLCLTGKLIENGNL